MRGLSFIGILIVLAIIAWLQVNSAGTSITDNKQDGRTQTEQVEQQVNDAMQQRMEKLRQNSP